MASQINFGALTLNSDEARDASQVIFEQFYVRPELARAHTIMTGVTMDRYIPILGQLGLVGKVDPGSCGTNAVSVTTASQKQWTPKLVSGRITHCQANLPDLLKFWAKSMTAKDIWSNVDAAMMEYITNYTTEAVANSALRLAEFGDTAADVIANGGVLTAGTDKTYFNVLNGMWKQVFTDQALGTPLTYRYTIAKNTEATYATQNALASDDAYNMFVALYDNIDSRAAGRNLVFQITRSLWNNWVAYIESKAGAYKIELLQDGTTKETFRGIPIVVRYDWDRIIKAYYDNGTSLNLPHRAILTNLENIPIGTSDEQSLTNFDSFYDQVTKSHYIDFAYKLDCKILEEYAVAVAY